MPVNIMDGTDIGIVERGCGFSLTDKPLLIFV